MTKIQKYIGAGLLVAILAVGTGAGLWVQAHNFIWQTPIVVKTQTALHITKKVLVVNTTIQKIVEPDPIPLNDNEKYLCVKFGDQCKIALQVQHLENGTEQCDRFHVNDNGTIDVGFMQINSIHLKKGYTLSDLIDCHKNIDIAYQIYKGSGWGAWVTYKQISAK